MGWRLSVLLHISASEDPYVPHIRFLDTPGVCPGQLSHGACSAANADHLLIGWRDQWPSESPLPSLPPVLSRWEGHFHLKYYGRNTAPLRLSTAHCVSLSREGHLAVLRGQMWFWTTIFSINDGMIGAQFCCNQEHWHIGHPGDTVIYLVARMKGCSPWGLNSIFLHCPGKIQLFAQLP